jgi:hypothetical protein
VFEIIDNSTHKALPGYCKTVKMELHVDRSCSVENDHRGIPGDIQEKYPIPAIELVVTHQQADGNCVKKTCSLRERDLGVVPHSKAGIGYIGQFWPCVEQFSMWIKPVEIKCETTTPFI